MSKTGKDNKKDFSVRHLSTGHLSGSRINNLAAKLIQTMIGYRRVLVSTEQFVVHPQKHNSSRPTGNLNQGTR